MEEPKRLWYMPKFMHNLIWNWILKRGEETDPYAVGWKVILIGGIIPLLIAIPILIWACK
jgi:hypothetical protein